VSGSAWPAGAARLRAEAPCSSRSAIVATWNECGDNSVGRSASFRRLTMRQTFTTYILCFVSWPVLRYAVRNRGVSLWAFRTPRRITYSKQHLPRGSSRRLVSHKLKFEVVIPSHGGSLGQCLKTSTRLRDKPFGLPTRSQHPHVCLPHSRLLICWQRTSLPQRWQGHRPYCPA
jgi:hypothetical protein